MRNVLPDWSVRLLVGTLLLPAFLTALDGFFRIRRRRLAVGPWLAWLGATALPVVMAWLWLRGLGIAGGIDPPDAPVLPLPPFDRGDAIATGSAVLVAALGWFGIRRLILARAGERGNPMAGSLAAATGATLCLLAALVWVVNPYAAALLLPAAHVWMFAAAPSTRLRGWMGAVAVAVGVLPFLVVIVYYARAFGLEPARGGVDGGAVGRVRAALVRRRGRRRRRARLPRRAAEDHAHAPARAGHRGPEPVVTRGPISYAGPGSLGGTESALRR